MPATIEEIRKIILSPDWTQAEKEVVMWQFRLIGDFKKALWDAICRADELNLARLEMGFPTEIEGYRAWAMGDLARRLRAAGLSI